MLLKLLNMATVLESYSMLVVYMRTTYMSASCSNLQKGGYPNLWWG